MDAPPPRQVGKYRHSRWIGTRLEIAVIPPRREMRGHADGIQAGTFPFTTQAVAAYERGPSASPST